ncbi:MAG: RNA methyltransferase, partial [Acidobacteriales bacterium]|nr:RNA methyltransferase [Terriglobales bacterium]
ATIVSTELDEVEFRLTEQIQSERSILEIHLLLSVFKFDRMEWAIEKAVELGCEDITPVIASRTDKHLAAAATKRVERWRKIAREAAQQSRQSGVPNISPPVPLKEAVQQARGARIVLNERERVTRLVDLVRSPQPTITLAVGPEGGWTDGELGYFQQAGWTAASLGCFILRAETATIAALVTAQASLPQN